MIARYGLAMIMALCGISVAESGYAAAADDRALVVVDKTCERIVQPYKLSDNIFGTVKAGAKAAIAIISQKIGKGDKEDVEDEMRTEAKRSNWLSMKVEVIYGQRAHEQDIDSVLERDSKTGKTLYPAADALLAELTHNLGEEHPYEFKLFILKNETRNAMARPGGYLYIDRGLLKDPLLQDKARFALGHELAHVFQRHETRELQGLIVDSFDSAKDLRKLSTGMDPEAMLKNVKLGKDQYVRHQIEQELQADACAVRLLTRAYPDSGRASMAIQAFLKDLPAAPTPKPPATPATTSTANSVAPAKILEMQGLAHDIVTSPESRHPTSAERAQNLRSMQAEVARPR